MPSSCITIASLAAELLNDLLCFDYTRPSAIRLGCMARYADAIGERYYIVGSYTTGATRALSTALMAHVDCSNSSKSGCGRNIKRYAASKSRVGISGYCEMFRTSECSNVRSCACTSIRARSNVLDQAKNPLVSALPPTKLVICEDIYVARVL
jgi:hypothetical protein